MDTTKLVGKLENFFDLSKKKQRKKHDKLLKIIARLKIMLRRRSLAKL